MSNPLRLFIWEGDGISDAYHDDGLFVVLAETPEQARQVARAEQAAETAEEKRLDPLRRKNAEREREAVRALGGYSAALWQTPEGQALIAKRPEPDREYIVWDGSDAALDRDPDRVVELTAPIVVAFNGGGYD